MIQRVIQGAFGVLPSHCTMKKKRQQGESVRERIRGKQSESCSGEQRGVIQLRIGELGRNRNADRKSDDPPERGRNSESPHCLIAAPVLL